MLNEVKIYMFNIEINDNLELSEKEILNNLI